MQERTLCAVLFVTLHKSSVHKVRAYTSACEYSP
ncbi:hypothetical protein R2APBS1_0135 [Rhodanobacter denitrificans]|uniref:Uncharacterized protein n=1 Tax=Rhodanobacter denitrificans TaxID=666685 RepID=M4NA72_9GAMM|nr:hypothetical protein R2APBS1_0135 [Rhodanobacter denitrificans]